MLNFVSLLKDHSWQGFEDTECQKQTRVGYVEDKGPTCCTITLIIILKVFNLFGFYPSKEVRNFYWVSNILELIPGVSILPSPCNFLTEFLIIYTISLSYKHIWNINVLVLKVFNLDALFVQLLYAMCQKNLELNALSIFPDAVNNKSEFLISKWK